MALEDVEEAEWNSTNQDDYWCDKLYLEVRDEGSGTKYWQWRGKFTVGL